MLCSDQSMGWQCSAKNRISPSQSPSKEDRESSSPENMKEKIKIRSLGICLKCNSVLALKTQFPKLYRELKKSLIQQRHHPNLNLMLNLLFTTVEIFFKAVFPLFFNSLMLFHRFLEMVHSICFSVYIQRCLSHFRRNKLPFLVPRGTK